MTSSTPFVFVIDDDESVRRGLKRFLRSAKYESEVFKSASDRWIDAPNVQYITAEYYRREIQGGRDGIIKAAEEASRSSGAFLLEYKLTLEQEGWFTGRKV